MGGSDNPELQRLLDSLSRYSGSNSNLPNPQGTHASIARNSESSAIPGLGFLAPEPPSESLRLQSHSSPLPQPPRPKTTESTSSSRNSPFPTSKPPIPDASTITTWPAAVKHVAKYLAPNKNFEDKIRDLIATQHRHEQQWYDLRQALIAVQASRATTSAQASAIMRSLNPGFTDTKTQESISKERELEEHDKKVYAGLLAMAADFDRQLRKEGVPFYAIKHELVVLEDGKERPGAAKGRIDKGELRELQKRMLQHLEDLCGE